MFCDWWWCTDSDDGMFCGKEISFEDQNDGLNLKQNVFSWKRRVRTDQWNLLWLRLLKGCSVIDIDRLSQITECFVIGDVGLSLLTECFVIDQAGWRNVLWLAMSEWAWRRNALWLTKPDDGMFCDWPSRMTECSAINHAGWRNVLWLTMPDTRNVLWLTKPDGGMFCQVGWQNVLWLAIMTGQNALSLRMTDWAWWQQCFDWRWLNDLDDGMFFDRWWLTEPLRLRIMAYGSDGGIFYSMLDDDRLSLTGWRNDDERNREKNSGCQGLCWVGPS